MDKRFIVAFVWVASITACTSTNTDEEEKKDMSGIIRPDELTGSARISGNGTLIFASGVITSVNRTGAGIYEIGLSAPIDPNEHTYTVTPILSFAARASGSVNVNTSTPLIVQTTVGGVAADLDYFLDIRRVRTNDGATLPNPAAIPAAPPPPPGGGLTSVIYAATSNVGTGLATVFLPIIGDLAVGTEPQVQIKMRATGTLQNMRIFLLTNSLDGVATVRLRKNTANGNQAIVIGPGLVGEFEDTVNTDDFVSGNLIACQIDTGASTVGGLTISSLQVEVIP